MNQKSLTEEQKKYILDNSQRPLYHVSREIGKSYKICRLFLKKNGIEPAMINSKFTEKDRKWVLNNRHLYTTRQMHEMTGVKLSTIRNFLHRLGLRARQHEIVINIKGRTISRTIEKYRGADIVLIEGVWQIDGSTMCSSDLDTAKKFVDVFLAGIGADQYIPEFMEC